MQLYSYRYSHREEYFRRPYPQLATIWQWLHALLESRRRGDRTGDEDPEAEQEDAASAGDSDAAGWTTDEEKDVWDARLRGDLPSDLGSDSSDEEIEWPHCDNIRTPGGP